MVSAAKQPTFSTALAVILFCAIVMTSIGCAEKADEENPYSYLTLLSEKDLRKMLHDKTNGAVDVSRPLGKEKLISILTEMELTEEKEKTLTSRVNTAMEERKRNPTARSQPHRVEVQYCTG